MSWGGFEDLRLESDAVLLRPLGDQDFQELRAIALEPEIWEHFVFKIDSEDALRTFLNDAIRDTHAGTRAVFGIVDKASGRLAGSMAFGNLAEKERRLEVGWSWLGRDFRGTHVNTWAKYLMLNHAFERMACERVEFKTDVLNLRARAGLKKIGATEEGVLRSFNYMPGGRRRDAVYYSVLRREWPAVKEALATRLARRNP
jgi:RimJ/RimL family protein N-acetyltransferase